MRRKSSTLKIFVFVKDLIVCFVVVCIVLVILFGIGVGVVVVL